MSYKVTITLLIALAATGCSSGEKRDPVLKEAAAVHNEAVAIVSELKEYLAKDSIHAQDSIRAWQREIEAWENELIEVAGNDKHDHSKHVHGHSAVPDITPEQMLAAQLEMKKQIESIRTRIEISL